MLVPVKTSKTGYVATIIVSRKRPDMAFLGPFFTSRNLKRAEQPWRRSAITKLGAAARSWTDYCRAVAGATGRRFKSCQPDYEQGFMKFYGCVLVALCWTSLARAQEPP